jgi:pimeloyl-ACP methyl ester carboxylesterase
MLEDIESIRKHYDDKKFAFIGTSFGSQWALSYLRQYIQNVDRMILAGVEPLDRNHDKLSDR